MNLQDFNREFVKDFVEAYGKDTRSWGFKPMSDEKPVNPEEIAKRKNQYAVEHFENLLAAFPSWWTRSTRAYFYDNGTHLRWKHYLTKDEKGEYNGIRWDRIHGKHRKKLKFELKNCNKEIDKQYKVWDKYAGRQDVAYIYIKYYNLKDEVYNQPWFLETVDDYFEPTYRYVFIKIDEK